MQNAALLHSHATHAGTLFVHALPCSLCGNANLPCVCTHSAVSCVTVAQDAAERPGRHAYLVGSRRTSAGLVGMMAGLKWELGDGSLR